MPNSKKLTARFEAFEEWEITSSISIGNLRRKWIIIKLFAHDDIKWVIITNIRKPDWLPLVVETMIIIKKICLIMKSLLSRIS
jgi:hypothetical protein